MNKKLELFLTFFKIGAFTFGGGYAMIPLIREDIVEKKGWLSDDEMLDMLAIAESTPGVIAVNSATFVGYKIAGFWGSFFATLGVVIPSFIIILLIALFFEDFLQITIIANAFRGIRAGVTILILKAGIKLFEKMPKTAVSYFLLSLAFALSIFVNFRYLSLLLIVFGFSVGFIGQLLKSKKEDRE
ncbi:MAG: chromate transporter [Bacilli bacterium]|nr:chromate transporter [Bacilli bacterium]